MEEFEKNEISETAAENVSEEKEIEVAEVSAQETPETAEVQQEITEAAEVPKEDVPAEENAVPDTEEIKKEQPTEQPAPIPEPIEYSEVNPTKNTKEASKGLKTFCVCLAAVIALTAFSTAGYFIGRNSVFPSQNNDVSKLDLAARPKNSEEMTPAQVYETLNPSIVGIRVYNANGEQTEATGVVYSKDGYIITNDHIYAEVSAAKFKIFTSDKTEYDAKYVAGDTISDLAVLKVDTTDLKPAVFGDSSEIFAGENVVAIGRPSSATDDTSITSGIISLTSRRVQTTSNYSSRLIQTDSAINPGSSGGALSNMFGQVVGITSSKLAGVQYDAIGFAIPTVTVKRVAEQLISKGKVEDRGRLGISYTEADSVVAEIKGYRATGICVAEVDEKSNLYGKLNVGDIITHINGIKIVNDETVLNIIEDAKAGDSISITVYSASGTTADYTAKLIQNSGQSSYNPILSAPSTEEDTQNEDGNGGSNDKKDNNEKDKSGDGGAFNFPFGY